MAVDYLPFAFHSPKQIRLVATIVNSALVLFHQCLYFDVRDGPREIAFNMSLDVGER